MVRQQKLENAIVAGLVLAILAFYWTSIRLGVTWADDWAMYIQDALNLLEGRRYSQTGYIVNPELDIGPAAVPPLYPLTLTLPAKVSTLVVAVVSLAKVRCRFPAESWM